MDFTKTKAEIISVNALNSSFILFGKNSIIKPAISGRKIKTGKVSTNL
jgi:hypothetical protein